VGVACADRAEGACSGCMQWVHVVGACSGCMQ
jgi:hypothetical protein